MARTEVRGGQILDATVSLTVDVTDTLPVANGGTNSTTLTLNNVLLGNGTGALQTVAPGSSGNVLTSNGTTWSSSAPAGGGGGLTWTATTVDATMAISNGYLANKGTLLTLTLPVTAAVGSTVRVAGMNAGLWKIAQAASQQIHFGNQNTTAGVTGSIASVLTYDAVELVCTVANLEWVVIDSQGNITVV